MLLNSQWIKEEIGKQKQYSVSIECGQATYQPSGLQQSNSEVEVYSS